jgi:hypothetical protein
MSLRNGQCRHDADSKQADFCAYVSAILLAGLLFDALLSWW